LDNYIYESEFGKLIKNILSDAYNLKDNVLEEYLLERYLVLNKRNKKNNTKNIDLIDFSNFIADELFINVKANCFFYKETTFYVSSVYGQSIYNIIINWPLFSKISGFFTICNNEASRINQIETHATELIKKGKNKASRIKGFYKGYVYKNYILSQLNSYYGIIPKLATITNDISPIKEYYYSGRNLETICSAYMRSMMFDSNKHELKLEKDIEKYLFLNIDKVFPNKKVICRQKNIGNGCILDMVIEDDNYEYIVELKNKKDDRLYWQVVKYYNYYKRSKKPIRVITLAPEYSSEMLETLKEIEYLDIFLFSIRIQNEKITDMVVNKIS